MLYKETHRRYTLFEITKFFPKVILDFFFKENGTSFDRGSLLSCNDQTQNMLHTRLKDISTPDFSTPSFNPRPFNPRLFNHELSNPVLFNPRLLNHELFNPRLFNPKSWVEKFMVKKSWVEKYGV